MRVSVFGLGYVGCVTTGCLARDGHEVVAVDIVEDKVKQIARGMPTVVETGLEELIADGHRDGRIVATTDTERAVLETDASIICVGTPNGPDGQLDLTALKRICKSIGRALIGKTGRHVVMNRSTVPAGTAENVVRKTILAACGKSDEELEVLVVPEFLREGSAVADYDDPPFVVLGSADGRPSDDAGAVDALFGRFSDRIRWLPFREAEMLKGLCNVFHAMKVAFANEVGALAASLSVDGRKVMSELTQDRKLNISPAYLRPGLPFGGSCLPKDLRMLISLARENGLDLPLLCGILSSNEAQLARAIRAVTGSGRRRIGLDGLAFKSGTDDLRESPLVLIAETLIGKGYDVKIYDPDVQLSCLTGTNRRYIEEHLPHLAERMVESPTELLEHAETVVLTREKSEIRAVVTDSISPINVVDLVRLAQAEVPPQRRAAPRVPSRKASPSPLPTTKLGSFVETPAVAGS
jgi:GDP-mannose 6-dehydrogenase